MKGIRWGIWGAVAFGVTVGVAVLMLRRMETTVLRDELAYSHTSGRELENACAENERLRAQQISPAELAALRADRAAVDQRRRQIEVLKMRLRDGK